MSSALAAAVNCPLPASVPSSPCASRRTLPPLTHDSPGLDPSYSQSSSDSCEPGSGTGTHDAQPTTVPSDVGQEWDVVSPAALPALALSLSVPEHHSPRKTGGKLSKMLKPFFGRASSASAASSSSSHHAKSSPLARTFSREEAALINGDAQRGRSSSFLSAGSRNSSVSRDASLTRERRDADFGAPLHRWTSEGGPNGGLPVSKKKRHMLFGGGGGGGVPLGRTQSLTSLSGKDDKKAKAQQQQQRSAVVTNGGRKQQRMLNGRVYGAPRRKPNANPFANVRYVMAHLYCLHSHLPLPTLPLPFLLLFLFLFPFLLSVYTDTLSCVDRTDEEFVEWGYGGMGSVKNTAGQNSMWSRVQASDDAAGLARRTTDEDDGSGMAWLKRRREQREREKKEAEERAQAEAETEAQEKAETNAEEGGAGEVAQEGEAGVKAAAAAEEQTEAAGAEPEAETNTEDKEDAPVDASTVPLPVSVPSTPLVPDTPKPEHITQAINVPAPHAHHRHHHSHSHSHTYSHHGHHHTLSMPFVERRESAESARPAPVSPPALAKVASEEGTPVPAALRTSTENKAEMEVEVEAAERESVSSSSASAMSNTSDDADEEESPKDTEGEGGFGQDEDEDEEDEEAVSRFVLSLPCAWRYGKEVC